MNIKHNNCFVRRWLGAITWSKGQLGKYQSQDNHHRIRPVSSKSIYYLHCLKSEIGTAHDSSQEAMDG